MTSKQVDGRPAGTVAGGARDASEHTLLESIAANCPGIIYRRVMNADGAISYSYVGEAMRAIYGLDPEEVVSDATQLLETIVEEDRERFSESLRKSADSLSLWRLEFRIRDREGRVKWVQGTSKPYRRENGDVVWDGMLLDITDRKEAEQAVRNRDAQFREILDKSMFGTMIRFGETIAYANDVFAGMHGYPMQTLIGMPVADLIHPDDRARLERHVKIDPALNPREGDARIEYKGIRSDGAPVWFDMQVRRVTWEGRQAMLSVLLDISDRKRMLQALELSEQRFRDFAEAGQDWFWELDGDLEFTYHTGARQHFLNYTVQEIAENVLATFNSSDDDRSAWNEFLDTLMAHRPFREFRYRTRSTEGGTRYLSVSGMPIFDAEGNFAGYRGAGVNVTAIVEAERRRSEAEVRFSRAIETAPAAFALFDADERLVICNREFRDLFSATADDLVPGAKYSELFLSMRDAIAASDGPNAAEEWMRLCDRGEGAPAVKQDCQLPNGHWLEFAEHPFDDGGMIFVGLDVTERKRAERELIRHRDHLEELVAERTRELKAGEKRFRDFAESSSDWFWETDENHRFSFLSDRLETISGVRIADVMGKRRDEVGYLSDDQEAENWRRHYAQLEARQPFRDFRYLRDVGDRGLCVFSVSGIPVFDDDGKFVGYRGMGEDVTEVVEATRAAKKNERLAGIGQLTATVSHELRNPLGTIRSSFYVVRDDLGDGASGRTRRALDRVERNIKRCVNIIEELLAYTRSQGLNLARLDLGSWAASVLVEMELPRNVTLRRSLDDGVMVMIDPDRFRQALINVVQNACQAIAGQQGEGAGEIHVSMRKMSGKLGLVVSDNGPGMPAHVRQRIFEPLFSTKSFGVGLGLPLVKQILEQHGGGVEVETMPDEGTTILLWLDAARSLARKKSETADTEAQAEPSLTAS